MDKALALKAKILNILFKNGVKEGAAHQIVKQIMKSPELYDIEEADMSDNISKLGVQFCDALESLKTNSGPVFKQVIERVLKDTRDIIDVVS